MSSGSGIAAERHIEDEPGNLFVLAVLSLVVGAMTGAVAALFRLSLEVADEVRTGYLGWARDAGWVTLPLVLITCAVCAAAAAAMVARIAPHAEGSGIPRVESVVAGRIRPAQLRVLPVKFVGGVLAIGSGLALGREGPSVQMGGSSGHAVARLFRRNLVDDRMLIAAGAGAGLATAFNAPVAGAIFVLEELVRRFDTRITIATLGASGGAIAVARMILGDRIEFHVPSLPVQGVESVPLFLALGVLCGVVGVAYNVALLWALAATDRWPRHPVEVRAAAIGGAVGLVAWFAPHLVGGGQRIVQDSFDGRFTVAALVVVLLLRFGLGIASYAARTPGGLFAPMLVLGAQLGLLFGHGAAQVAPGTATTPAVYGVVAMAAFFTAVVRSPVTGMVLVAEMTNAMPLLPPMLGACFVAMLVATLLRNAPVYESLAARARDAQAAAEPA